MRSTELPMRKRPRFSILSDVPTDRMLTNAPRALEFDKDRSSASDPSLTTSRRADMSPSPDAESLGVTLNANQRRHYGILFVGLEATLAKIETAVVAPPSPAVTADLPRPFRDGAQPILHRIRQELRRLVQGLAIETHPMSQRQTCRALLTSEISRIEESYASHLRGYGAVDESVGTVLDPLLRDMRADLGQLVALLSVGPDENARPS